MPIIFKTQKDFILALLEGRKFKLEDLVNNIEEIHYDETMKTNPFRVGDTHSLIDWEIYKERSFIEVKNWYDDIPQEGVLCWVTDIKEKIGAKTYVDRVTSYKVTNLGYSEFVAELSNWVYATPIGIKDVYTFKEVD